MDPQEEREDDDHRVELGAVGFGALRLALLFGGLAVALALIIAPIAERQSRFYQPGEIDGMTTGSIRAVDTYTIRRSVLQPSPDSVCVIRADGTRRGAC